MIYRSHKQHTFSYYCPMPPMTPEMIEAMQQAAEQLARKQEPEPVCDLLNDFIRRRRESKK